MAAGQGRDYGQLIKGMCHGFAVYLGLNGCVSRHEVCAHATLHAKYAPRCSARLLAAVNAADANAHGISAG